VVSSVLTFAAFPASLAKHHPGRTSSAPTREGSRVLQLPVCLAFPPLPQFAVLFYMAKTKEFIFIKCSNRLFDISLIFQRCQIPQLPLSTNGSSLPSVGEAGRELGCPAARGCPAGNTPCLSWEASSCFWEVGKNN